MKSVSSFESGIGPAPQARLSLAQREVLGLRRTRTQAPVGAAQSYVRCVTDRFPHLASSPRFPNLGKCQNKLSNITDFRLRAALGSGWSNHAVGTRVLKAWFFVHREERGFLWSMNQDRMSASTVGNVPGNRCGRSVTRRLFRPAPKGGLCPQHVKFYESIFYDKWRSSNGLHR